VRLVVAVVVAIVASLAAGYFVAVGQLKGHQIAQSAAVQRSDVRGLEALAGTTGRDAPGFEQIDDVLDVLGQRPGTLEVTLIDPGYTIRASGFSGNSDVGRRDVDPRITAALRTGAKYVGRDTGLSDDPDNFEFVSPVVLSGARYALVVVYDHKFLDATVATVRETVALIALLVLFGGGLVFYLVGGRALLRSHRLALHRATRDGLTDMPNHRAFQDEFAAAVASAARHDEPLMLAVVDVDDFKHTNDRHGHPYGDAVLRRVAGVLAAGRVEDRAYRLGGDEFALLLPRADGAGARRLAERLSHAMNAAETVVSIGVSNLHAGQSAEDLHAEADAALYEAKRRGGNCVAHFDEIREKVTITTSKTTDPVRRIIAESGISTVYQPIWDLDAGVLLGVEALMRPDPKYGLRGPEEAFDLAEKIGEVHKLDELCVRSALRIAPDLPELTLLFLNLAPQTLDLDEDGNDWLLEAVHAAGIAPTQVVIEITERFGGRTASVVKALHRLREEGFKLAIDDVGTGNSGLEMLRQVEAEFVKIDRSIVTAAFTEPAARAVLMAMATYASQTNSLVIAEGIEDQETLDFLNEISTSTPVAQRIITGGQGFGLGRPAKHIAVTPPSLLKHLPSILPVT
jgi:diguanylate cyclase (GGDEF)-like protein